MIYNEDCLKTMGRFPDKYFDLGFSDPPEQWKEDMDIRNKFFAELFRVSKTVVAFGYNHYHENLWKGTLLIWNKGSLYKTTNFDEALVIWINAKAPIRVFNHFILDETTHPSEKPVVLYEAILRAFPEVKTVYDAHMGSGNLRKACYKYDKEYTGSEIDGEYCERQERQFANYKRYIDGLDKITK